MDVLMMADFETKGKQKVNVDVHYVNTGIPCVVQENFEGDYHDNGSHLLADVLQCQETVYQSLQGTRRHDVAKASSSTYPRFAHDGGQSSGSTSVGNPSGSMNFESQLAVDEALARELQYAEDNLAATSLSETTITAAGVPQERSPNPPNGVTTTTGISVLATRQDDIDPDHMTYEATRQDDIDPDHMTYEQLQSLGEAIGAESRGLSDELISFLPTSIYKTGFFSRKDKHEECVICCMSYKNREVLITLPCKHCYHSHCVKRWLKINKACPICNEEVFGS